MKMTSSHLFFMSLLLSIAGSIETKQKKLKVINDTKEAVEVNYPGKTKEKIEMKLLPGKSFQYKQGTATIFVPSEHGNYEVTIPLSRAAGALTKITLMQIMEGAEQKEHTGEYGYYTEEGKIGDINIFFEKIID